MFYRSKRTQAASLQARHSYAMAGSRAVLPRKRVLLCHDSPLGTAKQWYGFPGKRALLCQDSPLGTARYGLPGLRVPRKTATV